MASLGYNVLDMDKDFLQVHCSCEFDIKLTFCLAFVIIVSQK